MVQEITTINLKLPMNLGSVNCYLVSTGAGFFLIDTGSSNKRSELEEELERAGCQPGNLQLIVLTHGDFDHTGNAAHLRKKFNSKIAMHAEDLGMVEHGDMFGNRQKANNIFTRKLVPILFGFGKSQRFKPDIYFEEGDALSEYGLEAQVINIPGHTKGSIGILTKTGDLFCGDLLESTKEPDLNSLMDDLAAADTSVEKLKGFDITSVYPGHGNPFPMQQFLEKHQ